MRKSDRSDGQDATNKTYNNWTEYLVIGIGKSSYCQEGGMPLYDR